MQLTSHTLFALLLILYVLTSLHAGSIQAADLYPLNGQWRFQQGDDPQWADPTYPDQQWAPVKMGISLQSQGVFDQSSIGWYRVHFNRSTWLTSNRSDSGLSLFLGRIMEADEVFLNGVRLGGEGRIADTLPESIAVYNKARVYPIPSGLLRTMQANILAIRVQGYFLAHGLVDREVVIGDSLQLAEKAHAQQQPHLFYETVFFTCLLILLLVWLAMKLILPMGGVELNALGLFAILLLISGITESLSLYLSGYKGVWATISGNIAYALIPVAIIHYGQSLFKLRHKRFWVMVKCCVGLLALASVAPFSWVWTQTVAIVNYAIWLSTSVYLSIIAFSSMWRQQPGGLARAVGFTLLILGNISLLATTLTLTFWPVMGCLFAFAVCMLVAYCQKLGYLMSRFRAISEHMADAVEEERRRLSRDLHDTLGQQLALLQFRLKLTQQHHPKLSLGDEIELVAGSITELRRVIHDQRPLVLEQHDNFIEALRFEISRVNLIGILKISLEVEPEQVELCQSVAQHIFRIVQECLHNANHHGEASQVQISVSLNDGQLNLAIADNGIGFSAHEERQAGAGMGLVNMQDRSRIINGTLSIHQLQPRGTCVELSVPC